MLIDHVTVFNPTDKSCLRFSFDFMGFYYFTCINLELIKNSLWQPRFHAGILVQEVKSAVFGIMEQISMGSISSVVYHIINYHCAKFGAFTTNSTIISPICRTKRKPNEI